MTEAYKAMEGAGYKNINFMWAATGLPKKIEGLNLGHGDPRRVKVAMDVFLRRDKDGSFYTKTKEGPNDEDVDSCPGNHVL